MWDYGCMPPGKMEVVEVASAASAGGENKTATLGPTNDRELWLVYALVGFHDDAAASRVVTFMIDDGSTDKSFYDNNATAVATTTILSLFNNLGIAGPVRLHYGANISVTGVNLDAGHKAYARALVYKIKGMESWSND